MWSACCEGNRGLAGTQSDWGMSLGIRDWEGPSGHIEGKAPDKLMGDDGDIAMAVVSGQAWAYGGCLGDGAGVGAILSFE